MLDMYFSAEDMELFRMGKTMSTIEGIIGCIAVFPFGWNAGYLLGAEELSNRQKNVLIGEGISYHHLLFRAFLTLEIF